MLYASTVRPFDHQGLRAAAESADPSVLLVEPYLVGTSAHEAGKALWHMPHRLRSAGVRRDVEVRAYGRPEDHDAVHGLDPAGIRATLREFLS